MTNNQFPSSARENARHRDGKFGEQPRSESAVALTDNDRRTTIVNALSGYDAANARDDISADDWAVVALAVDDVAGGDSDLAERATTALHDYHVCVDEEISGGDDVPVDVEQEMVDVLRAYVDGTNEPREMRIDDAQRNEIVRQIGGNLMSISGGRVKALPDGIEMPVSNGYKVRVRLSPNDTYRVERVFSRGGTDFDKGSREEVYADQVSEYAYFASCFRNDDGNWTYMG